VIDKESKHSETSKTLALDVLKLTQTNFE